MARKPDGAPKVYRLHIKLTEKQKGAMEQLRGKVDRADFTFLVKMALEDLCKKTKVHWPTDSE